MNWDLLISILVIVAIILIVLSKVSGQTVLEFLSDLKDMIIDWKEAGQDRAIEVYG